MPGSSVFLPEPDSLSQRYSSRFVQARHLLFLYPLPGVGDKGNARQPLQNS